MPVLDCITYQFEEDEFTLDDGRGATFATVSGEALIEWDRSVGEYYLESIWLDTPAGTTLILKRHEVTQPKKWLSECLFPQIEARQDVWDFVRDQARAAA